MMVSGARKGFWGVPPYERLGGRGVVSVPKTVKGRSLRLIALGVLLCCCALALGVRRRDARAGVCLRPSPAALKARKGALRICGDCRRICWFMPGRAIRTSPSCRLRSRPGRTPGSTACSLGRGRLYDPLFPPPRHWPFRRPEEAEQGAGMGGKPAAVDAGELGQADGERRSGCIPVPVRQGDYRAAYGGGAKRPPISPGSGTLPRPEKGIPSICSCTPRFRWGCRCLSCIPPPMARGYSWRRGSYPAGSHGGYGCDGRAVPLALRERDVCGHRP